MSSLDEGDPLLHEIEVEVRAELTIAETSRPEEEADGEPDLTTLLEPDAERYEASLRSLLGAVEAVEGRGAAGREAQESRPKDSS